MKWYGFKGFPSHSSHCSGGLFPQDSGGQPKGVLRRDFRECTHKVRDTFSTAGNSMTGSERPSPEPLLKKEASLARFMLWRLQKGLSRMHSQGAKKKKKTHIFKSTNPSARTLQRAENGWLDPSWLIFAFLECPNFPFRGPKAL